MSLQHFFLDKQVLSSEIEFSNNEGFKLNLNHDDFHHAKVLRLKAGEHIGVIDSAHVFYECEIVDFEDFLIVKNCQKTKYADNKNQLWLIQGVSKANKLDDIVRACTEIGVFGFIPVSFERSVVKLDEKKAISKIERWNKIAKSAAMQSGQINIPKINDVCSVDSLCDDLSDFDSVFVFWEESKNMQDVIDVCNKIKDSGSCKKIGIVVGPEGGISKEEVDKITNTNKNSFIVSFGDSILRTETAAIVACGLIKFLLSC